MNHKFLFLFAFLLALPLVSAIDITNCTDLQDMNNNLSENYVLVNNIDCSDTINWNSGAGFLPIGDSGNNFIGKFDGQGYNITDLWINRSSTDNIGLFGYIISANISNIGVSGSIYGANNVGGLIGYMDSSNILNSHSTADTEGTGDGIGGLIGYIEWSEYNKTIDNCYATGDVSGNDYVGGLIGEGYSGWENDLFVYDSYATGKVTGTGTDTGGLIGESYANITNCYALGEINGNGYYVGGLVGDNYGNIHYSYSTGNTTGSSDYVGGLVGFTDGSSPSGKFWGLITDSNYSGNVIGNNYVGGLVGYSNTGSISNSFAMGDINGSSSVGGLVGYVDGNSFINNSYAINDIESLDSASGLFGGLIGYFYNGTIQNSYATGNINCNNVIAGNGECGGLIGSMGDGTNYPILINSYSTGNVSAMNGNNWVGGLVGDRYSGIIETCFAMGDVKGGNEGFGGLIGYIDTDLGIINNSYATGNVNGSSYIGGLIGYSSDDVINSYAIGNVNGDSYTGGLIGENNGNCTSSYWNAYLSGQNSSACGTELNDSEMLLQGSYVDWDFTNIWDIETNSTPYLRFHPLAFFPSFPSPSPSPTPEFTPSYQTTEIYQVMNSGGAGLGVFIQFLGISLPYLFIGLSLVVIVVVIALQFKKIIINAGTP